MEGRFIKAANNSYATPRKPLVSQSANGRLSTYAVADAPAASKKDTYEVTDEYTEYFPEDKTQIVPGLQEVLDLDTKHASIIALDEYKKKNGITYGGKKSKSKKSKSKKSKTKKRKFRSTKNKKKHKRRSQKRI